MNDFENTTGEGTSRQTTPKERLTERFPLNLMKKKHKMGRTRFELDVWRGKCGKILDRGILKADETFDGHNITQNEHFIVSVPKTNCFLVSEPERISCE